MQDQSAQETMENQQEQTPPEMPSDNLEVLKQALAEQKQKADQYLVNWQRVGADLANYKKKTEQDRQDQAMFANAALISSLLPAVDDLERAFETIDAKIARLTWVDGIRLVHRKLQATLEAQGLASIPTVGERFDPRIHEAVMEVDGEPGRVISELQKGYKLRDRILRPAIVTVGRGESAATPEGS